MIAGNKHLRWSFKQFDRLKDIYLPRDYYTGKKSTEVRGRRRGDGRKEGYDRRRRFYSRSPAYNGSRDRSTTSKSRSISRSRDLPNSLFVRHLSHDCRQEDIRNSFKQFGPLKDICLLRDHHTGDRRGFGFVQFEDPADAAKAKNHMDGYVLLGRRLAVMFARDRGDGRFRDSRLGPSRSPLPSRRHHSRKEGCDRRRRRSYSRPPAYNGSRGCSTTSKSRSISRSPRRSTSRSPSKRSISRSPRRSISRSPSRHRSPSLGLRRSNTPPARSRRSPRPRRRRSNTPLPTSRNMSPRPRRRRSNTPVPPASSRRSPSPKRRRSNTPLPARSRSRGEQ